MTEVACASHKTAQVQDDKGTPGTNNSDLHLKHIQISTFSQKISYHIRMAFSIKQTDLTDAEALRRASINRNDVVTYIKIFISRVSSALKTSNNSTD